MQQPGICALNIWIYINIVYRCGNGRMRYKEIKGFQHRISKTARICEILHFENSNCHLPAVSAHHFHDKAPLMTAAKHSKWNVNILCYETNQITIMGDQWWLRSILNISWYHPVSIQEMQQITELTPLTSIIQTSIWCYLATWQEWMSQKMPGESFWKNCPDTFWLATMKNSISSLNLSMEDATELAMDWNKLLKGYYHQVEICTEMVQGE